MGDFTLLVAGMEFKEGPGFVLLAGNSVPGAELMLDSSCAVAGLEPGADVYQPVGGLPVKTAN